jgi:hypothetical protein
MLQENFDMLKSAANPLSPTNAARLLAAYILALSLTISACAPRKAGPSSATGNTNAAMANSKAAGQSAAPVAFADIPVPKKHKLNVEKTIVVGTNVWFGQLTYDTSYSSEAMFTFYERQLLTFGWEKITAVRALTSLLTYQRQNRVMTIAITQNHLIGTEFSLGSEVTITMSPKEQPMAAPAPAPTYAPRNPPPGALIPPPEPITGTPPTAR